MENWRKIWNSKKTKKVNSLQDLININGYEITGLNSTNLVPFMLEITEKLGIKYRDSVYEVGCGSGSILYILKSLGFMVGGCDYSQSLINIANDLDISDDIKFCEANQIDTEKKYNWILSFSVFQYFPDLEYVKLVIDKMLEKSKNGIAILDINDESKKENYHNKRRLADSKYDEKYEGYEHLFIDKTFWIEYAKDKELELIIEDQNIPEYTNSELRYNIYLKK